MSNEIRKLVETLTRIEEGRRTQDQEQFYNRVQKVGDMIGLTTEDLEDGGVFVWDEDNEQVGVEVRTDDRGMNYSMRKVKIDPENRTRKVLKMTTTGTINRVEAEEIKDDLLRLLDEDR